ncbi:MAG: DUF1501 domain-containing protein [bacterium]|nr:DUF1501 domain-containing protein [bacterium]
MPVTRRRFLTNSALGAAAFLVPTLHPGTSRAMATDPVLVVVFLRGAADGVNMAVPYGDGEYYANRPDIAIPSGNELDLDGFFGLNPDLGPLLPLFQAGKLDIIHAVGNPIGTRSHFDAMDYMETAVPGDKSVTQGWLNRYLEQIGGGVASAGITLGHSSSVSLSGPARSLAFPSLGTFNLLDPYSSERRQALQSLYQPLTGSLLGDAVVDSLAATELFASVTTDTSVVYPASGLGKNLKDAAALIRADVGVRVVSVDVGGWDVHSGEVARLHDLATDLGESLAAFYEDLGSHMDRTLVLAQTEFGRMLAQNGSLGCDHGHGSIMFALGTTHSRGRVLLKDGQWPGLSSADLYEGRDLAVTTDFRDVYAEILENHLGVLDPSSILPGFAVNSANYPGLFS